MMSPTFPPIITLTELSTNPIPPPEVLVEGLLDKNDKCIVYSGSKGKKSWTLMHLALSLASGRGDWWGFKINRPCKVLYIDFESKKWYFNERLGLIAKAIGLPDARVDNLSVWLLRGINLPYTQLTEHFKALLKDLKFDLIIIDPLYKFNSSDRSENDATDMTLVMRAIESIAVSLDAAVFLVHHSPKGDMSQRKVIDRGSGSGALVRDPDVVMDMQCVEDGGDQYVASFVLRSKPPVDPKGLRWECPIMVPDAEALMGKGDQARLQTLKLLPASGFTSKDWQQAAEEKLGFSRATFNRHKGSLHFEDLVECVNGVWVPMMKGTVGGG